MDWWLASFFLGALLSLFLPIVPVFFVIFLLLLLAITFFYIKPLRVTSGLFFGAFWVLFFAYQMQTIWVDNQLNVKTFFSEKQRVKGQVLTLQSRDLSYSKTQLQLLDKKARFNFQINSIAGKSLSRPITVRLSWKSPTFFVQQGQILQLYVKCKPSHGLSNLGAFNYQTWLNSKGIVATGYVVSNIKNQLLANQISIRQQLFNHYQKLLPEHALSPLMLALGFGERSQLSSPHGQTKLWPILQATSTGHLIAISGLHIGLIASAGFVLVKMLIRFLPLFYFRKSYRLQVINYHYVAIAVSLLFAVFYGYLAGFALPTVRALIMISLYWLSRMLAIKISIIRWLLLTLFMITLTSPFSLFTVSFWLSVYAVTIIFMTLWWFKKNESSGSKLSRFIKGLLIVQVSLTLMLWPISAFFFQQISLVSFAANMIAVPWMSFISIPLCLLSVFLSTFWPDLAISLIKFNLHLLEILWGYLTMLADQSWAVITLSMIQIQWILCLVFLGVLFIFVLPYNRVFRFKRKPKVFAFLISMIAIVLIASFYQGRYSSTTKKTVEHWQLIVFDVGQGLSVLLQKNNHTILYDTGAAYESGYNMVDAVILPYLQHQGISVLDHVIISHDDNDHAGGLPQLLNKIPIDSLVMNNNIKSQQSCLQGDSIHWQGLTLSVLWPDKVRGKDNDDSCVILVSDGIHNVLLSGDISSHVEKKLIRQYPTLRTEILLVPHHGSKTSSSKAFLETISPDMAIVSTGFLNRWHMPVKTIVSRYKALNIPLINTAKVGQVIIKFSEQNRQVQTFRDDLWPFWFANRFVL